MSFKALDIVDAYLKTPYSNLEKHNRRLQKIEEYENKKKVRKEIKVEENEC